MKNKNTIGIIIISIIVAIIIGIVIFVINNKKVAEDKPNEEPIFSSETIKQVVENSYKIAYLLHGDVKVADGYIINDGVTYYALDDELLADFQKIEDIITLINNNFEENFAGQYIEDLKNENNNNYIEYEGNIFVHKAATPCNFIYDYNANDSIAINKKDEEKYQVILNNSIDVWVYKNDNTYKMAQIGFYCQQ